MSIEVILQLIETILVAIGLIFAIFQVLHFRLERDRQSAMELLHQFRTPEFAKALHLVYHLPNGLSKKEIEGHLGDDFPLVYSLMTTWESIGILVFRGEISLDLVDDFFSGPITISWKKLEGHVVGERQEQNRETIEEWFQWVAERLLELESSVPPIPAHVAYKDWKFSDRSSR